eukprot:2455331-Amphidinium_carterae.1
MARRASLGSEPEAFGSVQGAWHAGVRRANQADGQKAVVPPSTVQSTTQSGALRRKRNLLASSRKIPYAECSISSGLDYLTGAFLELAHRAFIRCDGLDNRGAVRRIGLCATITGTFFGSFFLGLLARHHSGHRSTRFPSARAELVVSDASLAKGETSACYPSKTNIGHWTVPEVVLVTKFSPTQTHILVILRVLSDTISIIEASHTLDFWKRCKGRLNLLESLECDLVCMTINGFGSNGTQLTGLQKQQHKLKLIPEGYDSEFRSGESTQSPQDGFPLGFW